MDRTTLEKRVQLELTRAEKTLAKFGENFAGDPSFAFEWSAQAFDAAAMNQVAEFVKSILEARSGDEIIQGITAEARKMVLQGAKYPPRSTSVQSNEMERSRTAAWAELLNFLEGGI